MGTFSSQLRWRSFGLILAQAETRTWHIHASSMVHKHRPQVGPTCLGLCRRQHCEVLREKPVVRQHMPAPKEGCVPEPAGASQRQGPM
jgi:hypothetical protein